MRGEFCRRIGHKPIVNSREKSLLFSFVFNFLVLNWAAEALVNSYSRTQMVLMSESPQQIPITQQKWSYPPEGWFKANVDVAVKLEHQRTGLGIVIRNSEGKVMATAMKPTKFLSKVDSAKAEAAKLGLEIAERVGSFPLIIEYDSKEVVELTFSRRTQELKFFGSSPKSKSG